jgi:hypothetical protein
MGKFSSVKSAPVSVIKTEPEATLSTFEGAPAHAGTPQSDLFLLAITNMVGEDTFYEGKGERDQRFIDLIRKVADSDPDWIARFVPFLRDTMQMRSASVVLAAETVLHLKDKDHGINLRKLVDSAISRADEPAEMLAYVKQHNDNVLPKPVKRGVADAVRRLYNERNALKYDGQSRGFRMADVIDLTHVEPKDTAQSALFKFLLDRRHNRENISVDGLPMIEQYNILQAVPADERRAVLRANGPIITKNAGFTWETLSGWIPGGMDAEAWESVIPSMGYMALLRNLRNFEQAKISPEARALVIAKLTDPEEVKNSRQFPYRFYSAFKNTESLQWYQALEDALELSVQNLPDFAGKTLVLVDLSGSMNSPISGQSKVNRYEIGALFGAALAAKTNDITLVGFGTDSDEIKVPKGTSILKLTKKVEELQHNGRLGWGTNTFPAIAKHYDDHNRIVIFTDEQSFGTTYGIAKHVENIKVPIYSFNLAGYGRTPFKQGSNNRYEFGGFTDKVFTMMSLLERGKNAGWPF